MRPLEVIQVNALGKLLGCQLRSRQVPSLVTRRSRAFSAQAGRRALLTSLNSAAP
jgi:hypothetical protein